MNFEELHYYRD